MKMPAYLSETLYLMGDNKKKIGRLFILFLTLSLVDVLGLGIIGPYLALVVNPNSTSMLDVYIGHLPSALAGLMSPKSGLLVLTSLGLIFLFAAKLVITIYVNWIILVYSRKCRVDLQGRLMQTYQNQPYSTYIERNSAEYMKNIHDGTGHFVGAISILLRMLSEGLIAIVVLIFLIYTNPLALLSLVIFFGTCFYFYINVSKNKTQKYGEQTAVAVQKMIASINEAFAGFKEVRILGKEQYFSDALTEGANSMSDNWAKASIIAMIPRYFMEFSLLVFVVLMVLASIAAGQKLDSVLPLLGIFVFASFRLFPAVNLIMGSFSKLSFSKHSISLLYKDLIFLEGISTTTQESSLVAKENTFNRLNLNSLSFRYSDNSEWALKDIRLSIFAGESIGIIGGSGSGKTTLVDVMLGLLSPQNGDVTYNRIPLHKVIGNWRTQVAYLPQDVFIIDATLRENIALGVPPDDIDESKVKLAIKQAQLETFVSELPGGLEAPLGEKGIRLSGGQRQRVSLARAFYFERNVLILDEATSALDMETENEIAKEIKILKGNKTLIIIAHRLSTLQSCDRIYRLDRGKIVSEGTYKEVVEKTA